MFKDSLKELRRKNRISQEELADRLFVSRSLVAKWELGKRYPADDMLERIATLFGVDVKELIKGEEEHIAAGGELSGIIREETDEAADTEDQSAMIAVLAGKISEYLRTLPSLERKIFLRRYYYYESVEAISRDLGLDRDTVRTSLSEMRTGLQNYIEREGF